MPLHWFLFVVMWFKKTKQKFKVPKPPSITFSFFFLSPNELPSLSAQVHLPFLLFFFLSPPACFLFSSPAGPVFSLGPFPFPPAHSSFSSLPIADRWDPPFRCVPYLLPAPFGHGRAGHRLSPVPLSLPRLLPSPLSAHECAGAHSRHRLAPPLPNRCPTEHS
jgi:hypothetical protein